MKPENYPQSPKILWDQFYQFTQIPRPSQHEKKILDYLISLAVEENLSYEQDRAGNLVIRIPASSGREEEETVIIQNHVDMVTDARKGVDFDFITTPLSLVVENEYLKAVDTTLGADNGIGAAAAIALMLEDGLSHPPLELLFTVDEERGLFGALNLDANLCKGKKLVNLDTEEWGSFYTGCAGGVDYEIEHDFEAPKSFSDKTLVQLSISGLIGGHSGLDIHRQRGNAIKLLSDILYRVFASEEIALCEFKGGSAHNIIARDAQATLYIEKGKEIDLAQKANNRFMELKSRLPSEEENCEFSFDILHTSDLLALDDEKSQKLIEFIHQFPHGPRYWDETLKREVVSSSNNLAKVIFLEGKFYLQSSLRFFDRAELYELEDKIHLLAKNYGFTAVANSEYPSWRPAQENQLLSKLAGTYQELFDKSPEVTAIHAGLECGIILDKLGKMDAVSFGPTITGAHSPDERVYIQSVSDFWKLLTTFLTKI